MEFLWRAFAKHISSDLDPVAERASKAQRITELRILSPPQQDT
jgi:hypothetical protein